MDPSTSVIKGEYCIHVLTRLIWYSGLLTGPLTILIRCLSFDLTFNPTDLMFMCFVLTFDLTDLIFTHFDLTFNPTDLTFMSHDLIFNPIDPMFVCFDMTFDPLTWRSCVLTCAAALATWSSRSAIVSSSVSFTLSSRRSILSCRWLTRPAAR